jgi:hypothetical protein
MVALIGKIVDLIGFVGKALGAFALGVYAVRNQQQRAALNDAAKAKRIRDSLRAATPDELRAELQERGELRD